MMWRWRWMVCWCFLGMVGTACQQTDPAGVYVLSRQQMKRLAQEEARRQLPGHRRFGQVRQVMISRMGVSLTLKKGGAATLRMVMPNPFVKGRVHTSEDKGSWRLSWGVLRLELTKKGSDKPHVSWCDLKKQKIHCRYQGAGAKQQPLVFERFRPKASAR